MEDCKSIITFIIYSLSRDRDCSECGLISGRERETDTGAVIYHGSPEGLSGMQIFVFQCPPPVSEILMLGL